jgi:hypothetical protein
MAMTSSERRRPLPALVSLAALILLSGLVWYRVLHRDGAASQAASASQCATTSSPAAPRQLPRPRSVDVLVLNSTQRNGLAASAGKALARVGFTVTGTKNDEPSYGGHGIIGGVAEIRFAPADRAAATLLSYYLPGAKLVPSHAAGADVLVSLGHRFTRVADARTVRRALLARAAAAPPTRTAPASASASPSCDG